MFDKRSRVLIMVLLIINEYSYIINYKRAEVNNITILVNITVVIFNFCFKLSLIIV